MMQFIVLGIVPGTNLQFGFYHFLNTVALTAVFILGLAYLKQRPDLKVLFFELTSIRLI